MKHDSFFSANARPTPDLRFCFIHVYCKYLMKGGINTLKLRKILTHGLCIILVLIVLLIGWLAYMFLGTNSRSTDDMSYYMTISKQSDGHTALPILRQRLKVHCPYDLPKQEYLDSCLDYRFDHTAKRMGPFCSFAYTLICEFSEDAYAAEKASLDSLYTYTTEAIQGDGTSFQPEYELDGFYFRAVEGGYYPHEMLFIGYSDSSNEIAYIYFHDEDLDYVSPSLPDFINENTGWNNLTD